MLIRTVSQARTIPYWDDTPNLSTAATHSLIATLEPSLGDVDMS